MKKKKVVYSTRCGRVTWKVPYFPNMFQKCRQSHICGPSLDILQILLQILIKLNQIWFASAQALQKWLDWFDFPN